MAELQKKLAEMQKALEALKKEHEKVRAALGLGWVGWELG